MHFLLLNQTFYPDVASTAQHLKDLALGLAERGHQVTVVASQRAYDNPGTRFPARETWNGIDIRRIRSTGFGKKSKLTRALDFGSFLLSCIGRLLTLRRPDVVIALTSPPLISFIGACYARLRRARFVYWVMDLNPDEAVAAGWLKPNSLLTRFMDALSRFSFRSAHKIIVLDRFMADRVATKGIPRSKIEIIPPWSHDDVIHFDPDARQRFREQHGLAGPLTNNCRFAAPSSLIPHPSSFPSAPPSSASTFNFQPSTDHFVIMYSGNHSPCHPLTTLLEAAKLLSDDLRFVFMFVGGGSELPKVRQFAEANKLTNIRTLGYQPLDQLSGSLSAADLHVVVMGDPFVGTIHPCKIYNILAVGAPVLYIGPDSSHITDIFDSVTPPSPAFYSARHGDAASVAAHIRSAARFAPRGPSEMLYGKIAARFSKAALLPRLIKAAEQSGERHTSANE